MTTLWTEPKERPTDEFQHVFAVHTFSTSGNFSGLLSRIESASGI